MLRPMRRLLTPHLRSERLWTIALPPLHARGLRALLVDVDNTIIPTGGHEPNPDALAWLARAQQHGFALCLVSNARPGRVAALAQRIGAQGVSKGPWWKPGKPLSYLFRRGLACLGADPAATAVIGDQVFTDVLGGNALGLTTILVRPLSEHEFIGTRLTRLMERLVLRWVGATDTA